MPQRERTHPQSAQAGAAGHSNYEKHEANQYGTGADASKGAWPPPHAIPIHMHVHGIDTIAAIGPCELRHELLVRGYTLSRRDVATYSLLSLGASCLAADEKAKGLAQHLVVSAWHVAATEGHGDAAG